MWSMTIAKLASVNRVTSFHLISVHFLISKDGSRPQLVMSRTKQLHIGKFIRATQRKRNHVLSLKAEPARTSAAGFLV